MVAHQAPLSLGFSRQEHWSRLPCPPPGDLPDLWLLLSARFRYHYLVWCPVPLQGWADASSSFSSSSLCGPGKEVLFMCWGPSPCCERCASWQQLPLDLTAVSGFKPLCPLQPPGPNPRLLADHQSSQHFRVQGKVWVTVVTHMAARIPESPSIWTTPAAQTDAYSTRSIDSDVVYRLFSGRQYSLLCLVQVESCLWNDVK